VAAEFEAPATLLDPPASQAQRESGPNRMPYSFLALVAAVSLGAVYVFVTDASLWSKLLITGLVLLSLFGFPHLPLLRVLLQVGLSIFLIFCFKVSYELF
jgi:hypothetical protein